MAVKFKELTVLQIARLGTYAEEYIHDGARSERIRNPSLARHAALCLIRGEPILGGDELILEEYVPWVEPHVTKRGYMTLHAQRILGM